MRGAPRGGGVPTGCVVGFARCPAPLIGGLLRVVPCGCVVVLAQFPAPLIGGFVVGSLDSAQRVRRAVTGLVSRNTVARAVTLHRCGRDAEAETLFRSALAATELRYQNDPSNPVIRRELLGFLYLLAIQF